jgi:hypothetical protein
VTFLKNKKPPSKLAGGLKAKFVIFPFNQDKSY